MSKKRILALVLAGVMTMSVVAGCGSKTGEDKTATGSTGGTANAEKPVTIKWCVAGDEVEDFDLVMEDINKKLLEKSNLQLDLTMIPAGEFNDKMKLSSTSGEDYDLTFTSNWRNNFDENISRDAFLPLDDLYEKYGQDIKSQVPEWLMDAGKVDEKLYAIPNQQVIAAQLGVFIQKEYADKYGFDKTSIKDIREIEPFLDELVKNEPTMFPIDKRQDCLLLNNYEDVVINAVMLDKRDRGTDVVPITEVYEDQMRLDNEWYKKGYIRKDIATIQDNTADVKANRYICSIGTYKPGAGAERSAQYGVEWIMIPIEGSYVKARSGVETMTAINVNSKHPEEAMQLINLVYSDKEIFNELLFGLEGTHYNKTGDNSIEQVAETKYNYSAWGWQLGNQFNAFYLPGQEEGTWEETDKMNNEAEVSAIRGFTFNPENVQGELANVAAIVKEYLNGQFVTKDIDKFIAEKTKKYEQAGLQKIVDEVQTQINAWKG